MSTTTAEQTTTQEDVKDSKSSQPVSETTQSTETKKKPGPKPKVKAEDSVSEKSELETPSIEKQKAIKENKISSVQETNDANVASSQVINIDKSDELSNASEFVPAHILQKCPIYRTPSSKGVVIRMISGFIFCSKQIVDGFYMIKYNSFERGARIGYVESKYIAFGAKK